MQIIFRDLLIRNALFLKILIANRAAHHLLHWCGSHYYYTTSPDSFVYDALWTSPADPIYEDNCIGLYGVQLL